MWNIPHKMSTGETVQRFNKFSHLTVSDTLH